MTDETPASPPAADAQPPNVVLQTPLQQPQGAGPPRGTPTPPMATEGNGGGTRAPTQQTLTFTNSPQRPAVNEGKGLIKAVAALGRDMGPEGILKEFELQTKLEKVKEQVMAWTIPAVFGMMKKEALT